MSRTVWIGTDALELRVGMTLLNAGCTRWSVVALEPGDGPLPLMTVRDADGVLTRFDCNLKAHSAYFVREECFD